MNKYQSSICLFFQLIQDIFIKDKNRDNLDYPTLMHGIGLHYRSVEDPDETK
jgi:hypothetical protein